MAVVGRLTGPEGSLCLLVHLPDVRELDREHAEAVRVLCKQRLRLLSWPRHGGWTLELRITLNRILRVSLRRECTAFASFCVVLKMRAVLRIAACLP